MLIKAFAKINWSLDITGVRPDGYHLMDMIMQPVSLADDILLTPSPKLSLYTDGWPPSRADQTNLAWRAAELLQSTCGIQKGVHISLHKRIPTGAGMGGGSSDAAAVLFGLNLLWNLQLSPEELEHLGLSLGADVPFFIRGGLLRVRGIGEILDPQECRHNFWLLVFQPCRGLSTKDIFHAYHSSADVSHPDISAVLEALRSGNRDLLSSSLGNVLETVSAASCPEIPAAISDLRNAGAFAARMTGSGSAVFGVFPSRIAAEKARSALSRQYPRIHLCHTQEDSIRMMEGDSN